MDAKLAMSRCVAASRESMACDGNFCRTSVRSTDRLQSLHGHRIHIYIYSYRFFRSRHTGRHVFYMDMVHTAQGTWSDPGTPKPSGSLGIQATWGLVSVPHGLGPTF